MMVSMQIYLVLTVVLYTVGIFDNVHSYNRQMRLRVQELSSAEQRLFLNAHLRLPKAPKKTEYLPFAVMIPSVWWALNGAGIPAMIFLTIVNFFFFAPALLYVVGSYIFQTWYGVEKELKVINFFSKEEVVFLLEKVDSTNRWTKPPEEVLELIVWSPDNLVNLLKRKEQLQAYLSMNERFEEFNQGVEELTIDQQKRRQMLRAQLVKGQLSFSTHIKELMHATTQPHQEDGAVVEKKVEVNPPVPSGHFDRMEQQFLRELKQAQGMHSPVTPGVKPIHELEMVARSSHLAEETRKEAAELVNQLKDKMKKEEVEREQEMKELEARVIIESNRQFYGLSEE